MNTFNFRMMAFDRKWDEKTINGIRDLIDSGIGYWGTDDSEEDHELPLLFVIQENEPTIESGRVTGQHYRIDLATVALGINRILSGGVPINSSSLGDIACFVTTNDLQYIDSEDMDLIVQAGIYNELVWG